ncbi:hypothetical protein JCM11491_005024 [Sporobolomyces phaffii]
MDTRQLLVSTTSGPVVGFTDTHPVQQRSTASLRQPGGRTPVHKWLGIPYAQARRFQRPTDPEPWQSPRDCFEFGTMFPQPEGMTEKLLSKLPGFIMRSHIKTSEDSHFVNVFVPGDLQPDEKLPVMVFIYGGALNTGSSDRFFYDPTSLVRSQSGPAERCIIVTGNYRVNIFGFCASDDLSNEDADGLSGNYGLYDAMKIFEWVQANVSSFGGDPDQVTAFGQSAGAFLISYLLVSGKRLFHRAILQSGAQKTMGMRPASRSYPALASILSSLSSANDAASSSTTTTALLRSASTASLLALHASHHSLESVSLTIEPASSSSSASIWTPATIARLAQGDVDPWVESVVLGTTEDEGTVFAYGAGLADPDKFAAWTARFSRETRGRVEDKYLRLAGGGGGQEHPASGTCALVDLPGSKLLADQIFVNPVWDLAKAIATAGDRTTLGGGDVKADATATTRTKVWLYRLRTGVSSILANSPFGIMHSMDLPLIFNCSSLWNEDGLSPDGRSARAISSRWLRYGVTGQPDDEWKPFDPSGDAASSPPSWLVFGPVGEVENESLVGFERDKLDLVFEANAADAKGQEEQGDEVLGID